MRRRVSETGIRHEHPLGYHPLGADRRERLPSRHSVPGLGALRRLLQRAQQLVALHALLHRLPGPRFGSAAKHRHVHRHRAAAGLSRHVERSGRQDRAVPRPAERALHDPRLGGDPQERRRMRLHLGDRARRLDRQKRQAVLRSETVRHTLPAGTGQHPARNAREAL